MRMHGGLLCIAFCMYVCMSGCDLTKIHISATNKVRVMKFGKNIDVDDPKVDL